MSLWRWFTGERRIRLDVEALAKRHPWDRLEFTPPLRAFGPGAHDDFPAYLTGASRVDIRNPMDVASWLLQCRYAHDEHLLAEVDHWQHPCTFELVRSGDCEDYALWGWRKLVEAGYRAEFVVGTLRRPDTGHPRHAWVVFEAQGEEYVLDGVQPSLPRIIRPRRVVESDYIPEVGAAVDARRFTFAGLFRTEWGQRLMAQQPG
jgi:hypothetical protein